MVYLEDLATSLASTAGYTSMGSTMVACLSTMRQSWSWRQTPVAVSNATKATARTRRIKITVMCAEVAKVNGVAPQHAHLVRTRDA